MIPDQVQQAIKDRAEIGDVVGSFLELRRSGSRLKSACPFHDERTPSFYVTPSKGIYKCFGCGKGGDSISFLMEYKKMEYLEALTWLANRYGISTNGAKVPQAAQTPHRLEPKPLLAPSFIDAEIFKKSLSGYNANNLVRWICGKLGNQVVMDAVRAYNVGTAKSGGTIFWQVNIEGKAGSGHVIQYPMEDHHRIKSINPTWVHSLLRLTDERKYNWVKYWFGEHLLRQYPTRTVAIVESEKTALVCSVYFESLNFVWLASCGKDGLKSPDKWKVLQGREIVLYPDLSPPDEQGQTPFQYWTTIATQMQTYGFKVTVNDFLENQADEFERAQKWDLADFLLRRDLSEFQGMEKGTTSVHNSPYLQDSGTLSHSPANRIERFTSQITGESFEVILNTDNYPASWDN